MPCSFVVVKHAGTAPTIEGIVSAERRNLFDRNCMMVIMFKTKQQ